MEKLPFTNEQAPQSFSPDVLHAINEIKAIEQQIMQSGNVDSEIYQMEVIIHNLTDGKVDPLNAKILAHKILEKRQDYH